MSHTDLEEDLGVNCLAIGFKSVFGPGWRPNTRKLIVAVEINNSSSNCEPTVLCESFSDEDKPFNHKDFLQSALDKIKEDAEENGDDQWDREIGIVVLDNSNTCRPFIEAIEALGLDVDIVITDINCSGLDREIDRYASEVIEELDKAFASERKED